MAVINFMLCILACKALNCGHRCILSNDNTTARCACLDGFELDANGRSCNGIKNRNKFLVVQNFKITNGFGGTINSFNFGCL